MAEDNAKITYEVSGIGWKKQKEIRGRVTAKRVIASSAIWDRKGTRLGTVGMYHFRLLKYAIDGQDEQVIGAPSNVK